MRLTTIGLLFFFVSASAQADEPEVARVMQSPAGLNLDEIAVAEARTLRFRPAVDADGNPTFSHVVVKEEWQPYWSKDGPDAGRALPR